MKILNFFPNTPTLQTGNLKKFVRSQRAWKQRSYKEEKCKCSDFM